MCTISFPPTGLRYSCCLLGEPQILPLGVFIHLDSADNCDSLVTCLSPGSLSLILCLERETEYTECSLLVFFPLEARLSIEGRHVFSGTLEVLPYGLCSCLWGTW